MANELQVASPHNGLQKTSVLTASTFARGIRIIEASLPNLPLTEDRLSVWREMFGDLTEEQFVRGVRSFCLAHKEIYPNTNVVAHIRAYALGRKRKTAAEAWGEVLDEIGRVGSWGTPTFSSQEIEHAVRCIGWLDMCKSEQIGVERAHFMRAYDGIVERDDFNAVAGMGD